MGNLLFKTALKWSLVAFGIQMLASIPGIIFGSQANMEAMQAVSIILMIFGIFGFIVIYVIACLEFSKKRNHLANTGELLGLVGLMYGLITMLSLIWSFVSYKFFITMPEGLDSEDIQIAMVVSGLFSTIFIGLAAALAGITIAGMWRTFKKAGKEGWACIIPIYNRVVMCEIGQNPVWWVLMLFIPIVGIVFGILILHGISTAFGKDAGWTVGLVFLPFIFYPLLAWSDARYIHGDFEDPYEPSIEDHMVQ